MADRVAHRAWTLDTQSQIASISKQFVAACALVLISCGELDLDDTVGRYLPDAAPGWDRVTVRHLLTHTSGMTHWSDQPGFIPLVAMPGDERLDLLLRQPPPEAARGAFHYSSPGYIVLSHVIAAAAGQPYAELARKLVIERLDLATTSLDIPISGFVASGHRDGEPVELWDLSSMPGTGDVWSTAGDVARFVTALHTGDLLPGSVQSLLHDLRTPYAQQSAAVGWIRLDAYCAGHFLGSVDGRPVCVHPGDNPGYQSLALWLPDALTTVVALTNDELADIEAVAIRAAKEVP